MLADGKPDLVAWLRSDRLEERRAGRHGHELHGAHAERRDRLVANKEHVGSGTSDDGPADLVGRGTNDRSPDARGERREQHDEKKDGYPAMRNETGDLRT